MDKLDIAIKIIITITLAIFFIGMLELANDVSNQRIEINNLKIKVNECSQQRR